MGLWLDLGVTLDDCSRVTGLLQDLATGTATYSAIVAAYVSYSVRDSFRRSARFKVHDMW